MFPRPETGATIALTAALALIALSVLTVLPNDVNLLENEAIIGILVSLVFGGGTYRYARKRNNGLTSLQSDGYPTVIGELRGRIAKLENGAVSDNSYDLRRERDDLTDALAEMSRQRDMIRGSYDEQRIKLQRVTEERDAARKWAKELEDKGAHQVLLTERTAKERDAARRELGQQLEAEGDGQRGDD